MNIPTGSPVVSVIVPVYNGEKFLRECLESICRQSLTDLEILVVDDGSTDKSAALVRELAARDLRIKLLTHTENRGLFQARITGVEAAIGKWIGFVDADDSISIDWFRLLWECAEREQNDVTAGQFLCRFDDDRLEYFNLDPLRQSLSLEGEAVFDRFIGQEGAAYSWQLVWNKLYSRALWERILPAVRAFSETHPRFVMCEDIAFSAALWLRAARVGNVCGGAYYYYRQHSGSSTAKATRARTLEKLEDVAAAFRFMGEQIEASGKAERCAAPFEGWRLRYARMYRKLLKAAGEKAGDRELIASKLSVGADADLDCSPPEDGYFYSVCTVADPVPIRAMEELKARICSDAIDTVSFDVFDTLVVRPFFQPTDLFYLLNDAFAKLTSLNSYLLFSDIRVNAESECRKAIRAEHPEWEDVTLDEIYVQIARDYPIAPERLDQLREMEQALEIRFCTARGMGKQLADLARFCKKRVIICSDMYLPRETVEAILQKNAISYDTLYLSSELRVGKWTCRLFGHVQKSLGLPAERFLHIGDNLESDVKNPRKMGWNAAHLPRAMDQFRNLYPQYHGGTLYDGLVGRHGQIRDGMNAELGFVGYRSALALAVNRLFDDPFALFARDSDFDANPYRIGYFALGHYLFAVTDWLAQKAKREGRRKIHFVARDGYLPMEAYRILRRYDAALPEENYLYISRKALALTDVYNPVDLFSFWSKFPPANYSVERFDRILAPYYKDGVRSAREALGMNEKKYRKKFEGRSDYDRAIAALAKLVDFDKLRAEKEKHKAYFDSLLSPRDLLFDIGYSGRGEAALTRLLGYPVDAAYVHGNTQSLEDRERVYGFRTECFYPDKPTVTGVVREHMFMKLAPSAVGYEERDGWIYPQFEKESINLPTRMITETMQGAALDFVRDLCETFRGFESLLAKRPADLAYTFEYFLHYGTPKDRAVLGCVIFEDEMGYGKAFSALDYWNRDLANTGLDRTSNDAYAQDQKLRNALMPYPRWKKALCYLILDRGHFRDSFQKFLKK